MASQASIILKPRILIFDSGIGGLSILKPVFLQLPQAHYAYLADTAFWPYGEKSPKQIQQRLKQLFTQLDINQHFDIVIIACNTASTAALASLREDFKTQFIGVVPAIKPAAELTQTGHIALLATQATVNGDYVNQLHNDFAKHCELHYFALPELVHLAEQFIDNDHCGTEDVLSPELDAAFEQLLQEIQSHQSSKLIDTFILGCTHFPLVKESLKRHWPRKEAHWIDSGQAIAKRCKWLAQHIPTQTAANSQNIRTKQLLHCGNLLVTAELKPNKYQNWIKRLSHYGINELQIIDIQ